MVIVVPILIQDAVAQEIYESIALIYIAKKLLILIISALLAEILKAAFDFEQVRQYVRLAKFILVTILTKARRADMVELGR